MTQRAQPAVTPLAIAVLALLEERPSIHMRCSSCLLVASETNYSRCGPARYTTRSRGWPNKSW